MKVINWYSRHVHVIKEAKVHDSETLQSITDFVFLIYPVLVAVLSVL